jgi:hypothetical protein
MRGFLCGVPLVASFNFGFLWFESEYVISAASKWILAANAAGAIVK